MAVKKEKANEHLFPVVVHLGRPIYTHQRLGLLEPSGSLYKMGHAVHRFCNPSSLSLAHHIHRRRRWRWTLRRPLSSCRSSFRYACFDLFLFFPFCRLFFRLQEINPLLAALFWGRRTNFAPRVLSLRIWLPCHRR